MEENTGIRKSICNYHLALECRLGPWLPWFQSETKEFRYENWCLYLQYLISSWFDQERSPER